MADKPMELMPEFIIQSNGELISEMTQRLSMAGAVQRQQAAYLQAQGEEIGRLNRLLDLYRNEFGRIDGDDPPAPVESTDEPGGELCEPSPEVADGGSDQGPA